MGTTFAADYQATPRCIALVREQMATMAQDCGLPPMKVGDVRLAVSEAATNAMLHGYRNRDGMIRVEARVDDGELLISVCDEGPGLRPRADSPGLGLGLPVIASVANRLEVLDDAPGTRVRMAFDCPRAQAPDPPVLL